MLNDVLALCIAGAVVVVIATILGAVVSTVEGRRCYCRSMRCLQVWLPPRTRSPTTKTPSTAAMRTIHSSPFSTRNSLRPDFFTSLDVGDAQCDSRKLAWLTIDVDGSLVRT